MISEGIKNRAAIAVIVVFSFSAGVLTGQHSKTYQSYEDCVMDLVPKTHTRSATAIIHKACETKYHKLNVYDKFDNDTK